MCVSVNASLILCLRMTSQSRSRGGGQRPLRVRDAKSTSGKRCASDDERNAGQCLVAV